MKLVETVVQTLSAQLTLMNSLAEQEAELHRRMLEREWEEVTPLIETMSEMSDAVVEAENRRHDAYCRLRLHLGLNDGSGFAEVLAALNDEDRRRLAELYRQLKLVVIRLQSLAGGVDRYVRTMMATTREIIQEAYPDRSGASYGRDGAHAAQGGEALVLNHHL
ncbi:MAG: flagellar export chaperone FlgN [Alkalispirochaetaceae bacterium]